MQGEGKLCERACRFGLILRGRQRIVRNRLEINATGRAQLAQRPELPKIRKRVLHVIFLTRLQASMRASSTARR